MSMAQIHITVPLLKHAQDPAKENFNDLTTDAVTEYLTANLHWKATVKNLPPFPLASYQPGRSYFKGSAFADAKM